MHLPYTPHTDKQPAQTHKTQPTPVSCKEALSSCTSGARNDLTHKHAWKCKWTNSTYAPHTQTNNLNIHTEHTYTPVSCKEALSSYTPGASPGSATWYCALVFFPFCQQFFWVVDHDIHIYIYVRIHIYLYMYTQTHVLIKTRGYRVAKTHRIPYLHGSFSAKVTYV